MGNHSSRKDQRKWGKQGGKAASVLSKVEELRGPSVDSYDKLIAWLAEMAENDNVELDTSVFVSQLNRVCGGHVHGNHLGVSGIMDVGVGSSGFGNANIEAAGKRALSTRQNSASCDSHVSHASSDLTQRNRSSTRSDDFLDPNSAWRSGASTRQNTFSDDLEEEEDADLKNASVESLYSSTDRDSELGSILAYDVNTRRSGRKCSFQNSSPLLRETLINRLRCTKNTYMAVPCSSSTGNLNMRDASDVPEPRRLPNPFIKRRSVSLLNLSQPDPLTPRKAIPKVVLTNESDNTCDIRLTPEINTHARKKLGPKSLSLTSGRKRHARFERQFSLHSDPSALISMPIAGVFPPIFTPHLEDPEPIEKLPGAAASPFLNDDLLDRNIADILFSVEALWPKK